jgi:hypothetical protein
LRLKIFMVRAYADAAPRMNAVRVSRSLDESRRVVPLEAVACACEYLHLQEVASDRSLENGDALLDWRDRVVGAEDSEDWNSDVLERRTGVVVDQRRQELPLRFVVREHGEVKGRERLWEASLLDSPPRALQRRAGSHHRDDVVVVAVYLRDLLSRDPRTRHVQLGRVPLLVLGRHARPRTRDHERHIGATSRCVDDDPAALAVAEEPDPPSEVGLQ